MRYLVLLGSLVMPIVAWFAARETFGPDNATISSQYPTLIVAAGYAFSIWGLIFLLDVVFGLWQMMPRNAGDAVLRRIRPAAAAGFLLTAAWMIAFAQQIFWLALLIIWIDLGCLLYCAQFLAQRRQRAGMLAALLPLSLHAGWLSLAAFMNLAQVIVAYRLLPTDDMLPWSLPLLLAAALLILCCNHLMRGNVAFGLAGVWGLAAIHVEQSDNSLAGAATVAATAAGLAVALALQTGWLLARARRGRQVDLKSPGRSRRQPAGPAASE